jgi:hypothetical protein
MFSRFLPGVAQGGLLVLLAFPLATGCSRVHLDADTRAKFEVIVRITSDKTRPVPGAQLMLDGAKVGTTGTDGSATLRFVGNEGEAYDLQVACPAGLQSPSKPIGVTLRKLAENSRKPEFSAVCPPATQMTVVAVRAENGPNLPVLYLGKEVGRTDTAGAANVALRLAPNESFELTLGTDEKGAERLQPKNPTSAFTVKDHDDIVTFEKRFSLEKLKPRPVGRPRVGPKKL